MSFVGCSKKVVQCPFEILRISLGTPIKAVASDESSINTSGMHRAIEEDNKFFQRTGLESKQRLPVQMLKGDCANE